MLQEVVSPRAPRLWAPPRGIARPTDRDVARLSPIGCSLGAGGRSGKKQEASASGFDPATLNLTGWWRASYGGSPWVGTASAGSSGSNDISEGTTPPSAGATLNSLASADFDGTNDRLISAAAMTTFFSTSAYFAWCLFEVDTVTSGTGTGGTFGTENVVCDGGGNIGLAVYNDGANNRIGAWHWNGGSAPQASGNISLSTPVLACWRYDGTDIRLRINSGSVITQASANVSSLGGNPDFGNGFSAFFFDGRVWDIGTMATAESDAAFDDIKAYINARYALSL